MKYKALFFFLFLVLCIGCKCNKEKEKLNNNEFDQIKTTNKDSAEVKQEESAAKSYQINKKSVIFFMPTKKEIEQIIKQNGEYTRYDFLQLFNNFRSIAVSTRKALERQGIFCELTYASHFEIKTDTGIVVFDRKKDEQIIGQILADGKQKPVIEFGIFKNADLMVLIKNYFNLGKFENKELDSLEKAFEKLNKRTDESGD